MPKYKVAQTSTVIYYYTVEAKNEEDAIELVYEGDVEVDFSKDGGDHAEVIDTITE